MDLEYVGHVLARLRPLIRDDELRRSRLERVLNAGALPADSVRIDVERMLAKVGVAIIEDASAEPSEAGTPSEIADPQPTSASSLGLPETSSSIDSARMDVTTPPAIPRSAEALEASRIDHRVAAVAAARQLLSTDTHVSERRRERVLLTAELEVGLGLLMRGGAHAAVGDVVLGELSGEARQAAEALFLHNQRLVHKVAQKYPATGMAYEDLAQFGFLGLLRAVEKFDPTAGFKFSTYATWWIRQAITRGLADHSRLIRFPVHMVERLQKVWRTRDRLTVDGEPPSIHSLALATGFTDDQVVEAIRLGRFEPLSLDRPVGQDGEATLADLLDLEDDRPGPGHAIESRLLQEQLFELLDSLGEREAGIISMRFGLLDGEEMTLDQIGQVYGVTRERIRQIEKKTLEALRDPSRSEALQDFLSGRTAQSSGEDYRGDYALRRRVRYGCPRDHAFQITFSVEAGVPPRWSCPRCGQDAGVSSMGPPFRPASVTDMGESAEAQARANGQEEVLSETPDEAFERARIAARDWFAMDDPPNASR